MHVKGGIIEYAHLLPDESPMQMSLTRTEIGPLAKELPCRDSEKPIRDQSSLFWFV